ncbi:MAG: hypothetical protein KatS3mg129_1880 [Leptospiraceae bacterium]|nr:MAG: hypothetical protein KatS3mg129_1880 [Leptospiraceae bacterium]
MFVDKEKIQIEKYKGIAYLRYIDNIYHQIIKKNENEQIYILIQDAQKLNLFTGYYKKNEIFKITMLTVDWEKVNSKDSIEENLENKDNLLYIIKNSIDSNHYNEILWDFCNKKKIFLSYCLLEIYKDIQEQMVDNDIIQIAHYYSAGYPPLLLVENENYHFPLRAGIPLGITDVYPKKQTLEIPINSKIYIHTPINEKIHNLRELHYDISKNNLNQLPQDLLLFEYQFLHYEK